MAPRLKVALLAGAGLLLVQLGWILAIAPHYGIDEFDHAMRSSSVAAGNWQPGDDTPPRTLGRGDLIPVRADVARSVRTACEARSYTLPYNCRPVTDLDNGYVLIASGAARYNPTYYAVVGVAASPFHGTANLYALRVTTAVLACVLFGIAVWLVAGAARTRWPVLAVILAALPTTAYSASIATPNGVEMMAGLGTWAALLAVTEGRDRRVAYPVLALMVAALVDLHSLGLGWLLLITLVVAALHGPRRVLAELLPRGWSEGAAATFVALAVAFEVMWIAVSGANDPAAEGTTITGSPVGFLVNGVLLWPLQAIGAFPMRDDAAPLAVYAIMLTVLGTLAVLTLRRTPLRSRAGLTLGLVLVASYAVPAALTVLTFHQIGSAWQGRYAMPFAAGLLLLAGARLDAPGRRPVPSVLALVAAGLLGLAHLVSQWSVVAEQRAVPGLASGTHWSPPSPALLVLLAVLATVSWVRALVLTAPAPQRAAAPDPARVEVPA